MPIEIKELTIDIDCINSKGVALAVYAADGQTLRGALTITKSGLEWCDGKKTRQKETGIKVSWEKVIDWMSS